MKKSFILLAATVAFTQMADARPLDMFLEDIPSIVKFILAKKGEVVKGRYGQVIEKGDDLTRVGQKMVGEAGSGDGVGDGNLFRLVSVGRNEQGEVLVSRGYDQNTLYILMDINAPSGTKYISKQITAAIKGTVAKISRRVDKAVAEVAENTPDFPTPVLRQEEVWNQFLNPQASGRVLRETLGKVYMMDISNMDPAVLQKFLEAIVRHVSTIKEL